MPRLQVASWAVEIGDGVRVPLLRPHEAESLSYQDQMNLKEMLVASRATLVAGWGRFGNVELTTFVGRGRQAMGSSCWRLIERLKDE
jgi:hypothetical protein